MREAKVVLLLCLLTFMACERQKTQHDSAKIDLDTLVVASQTEQVYHYVEPEENIVEQVWEILKAEHPEVQPVSEAIDVLFEKYNSNRVIRRTMDFPTKTEMYYDIEVPGKNGIDLRVVYEMKCYRTLDDSWLAIVMKYVNNNMEEFEEVRDGKEIFAVEYKGETLTDQDIETLMPEFFQTIALFHQKNPLNRNLQFDNDGFDFISNDFWPVRFNWNGKAFDQDPKSVILAKGINASWGSFDYAHVYSHPYGLFFGNDYISLGGEPTKIDSNYNYVDNGEIIAHFDVVDGKITGYALKSPKCGFPQSKNHKGINCKPIAIGFPISNVLDYEKKNNALKDTTLVAGYKDGEYVITQQLDENWGKKQNTFIEFTAKDEHSDIESIRVYVKTITVNLKDEVKHDTKLSKEFKEAFMALYSKEPDLSHVTLTHLDCSTNGFEAGIDGDVNQVNVHTYKTDDGKSLILLAKYKDGHDFIYKQLVELKSWYFENGDITDTDFELIQPKPEEFTAWEFYEDTLISPNHYAVTLTDEGIEYYAVTQNNDIYGENWYWGMDLDTYLLKYDWNGSTFVKRQMK